ncbi:MAG: hypothetical protein KGJ86_11665, partial [Chloroflexota bacterium]|nr:hypothetical protein [Chloroflexota bacterium]
MELEQTALPQQTTHISAKLVTSLQILQLSSEELAESIRQEMVENPALEIEERAVCPVCGTPLDEGGCPECMESGSRESKTGPDGYESTSYGDLSDRARPLDSEEDFDPLARVAAEVSLSEYLAKNLQEMLPEEDLPVAQFVIGSLDDSGYLRATDEEIAEACSVSLEKARSIVLALQRQDPP